MWCHGELAKAFAMINESSPRRWRHWHAACNALRFMRSSDNNPMWLVISEDRCSDLLHDLCQSQRWPLIEFVTPDRGLSAAIFMGTSCVAVELADQSGVLSHLVRSLAGLDTIDRVACILPSSGSHVEREAAGAGINLFTSVEHFAASLGILMPFPLNSLSSAPSESPWSGTRFAVH